LLKNDACEAEVFNDSSLTDTSGDDSEKGEWDNEFFRTSKEYN